MRQIILDTETTGLSPKEGHRIIEIGCLEMINRRLTGNNFHYYINPERAIDAGAMSVHGISAAFLSDKPIFKTIVDDFIAYIKSAELIIHNAPFDTSFLDEEFSRAGTKYRKIKEYCEITDTLQIARQKHPGQKNNLDALCKRYGVKNSHRQLHGALLDAELLAEVYLAMTGGQVNLFSDSTISATGKPQAVVVQKLQRSVSIPVIAANEKELQAHNDFFKD